MSVNTERGRPSREELEKWSGVPSPPPPPPIDRMNRKKINEFVVQWLWLGVKRKSTGMRWEKEQIDDVVEMMMDLKG